MCCYLLCILICTVPPHTKSTSNYDIVATGSTVVHGVQVLTENEYDIPVRHMLRVSCETNMHMQYKYSSTLYEVHTWYQLSYRTSTLGVLCFSRVRGPKSKTYHAMASSLSKNPDESKILITELELVPVPPLGITLESKHR